MVAGAKGFQLRFGQGLALLERDQRSDLRRPLAHQVCRLAQDLRALVGRGLAPDLEAPSGRRQGAIQVGGGGQAKTGDQLAGRGVEHIGLTLMAAYRPLAVNQKRLDYTHLWIP